MIQMQMNGRPLWLVKLCNQWNNVAVFICAGALRCSLLHPTRRRLVALRADTAMVVSVAEAICACYNSPPAGWVREWGANDYDSGFVVISWICLAVLGCLSRDGTGGGGAGAAAAAAKKGAGAPPGAMKKKKR